MDRRASLKTLLTVSVSVLVLPSCLSPDKKVSVTLKNITIEAHDEKTVTSLANAIIPPGAKPGAVAIGAPAFVWMMLDDCYAPKDQQKFMAGLKEFDTWALTKAGKKINDASTVEQDKILTLAQSDKELSDNARYFLDNVKGLTIRAYTQSEYYLTTVQKYVLVPGEFYGCMPVKTLNT